MYGFFTFFHSKIKTLVDETIEIFDFEQFYEVKKLNIISLTS